MKEFATLYFRFFTKPLLFIFAYVGSARLLICLLKHYKNFKIINFVIISALIPFSILIENDRRVKELVIFLFSELCQSWINIIKKNLKITTEKFDARLEVC